MNASRQPWYLFVLVVILVGCSESASDPAEDWSQGAKENAAHFIYSIRHANQANRTSNQGGPGLLPDSQRQVILSRHRAALRDARAVEDSILEKIHPDLVRHYRQKFQEGLRLRISNLEVGDVNAEAKGIRLLDEWGRWFSRHRNDLRIPKP